MAKKLLKRGMSPIIATILLIALAVSIGATVMSLGGVYYEKFRSKDADCSEVLINAFELDQKSQCQSYEYKSILSFYYPNETIVTPQCYNGVATGKGSVCVKPELLLGSSWVPIENIVR